MSMEEIERYNVLADEIRKLGLNLNHLGKCAANFEESLVKRQSALEDSLKHLHGKFALLNSRVAPIAQPKRKRERKHRKAA